MTPKERVQAIDALVAWFESQEIKPPDAACVIIQLLAEQFVIKNGSDPKKLHQAITHANSLLTACVVELLSPKNAT